LFFLLTGKNRITRIGKEVCEKELGNRSKKW
jgi:hypothetical protein